MTEAEIAENEAEVRAEIMSLMDSVSDGFLRGDAEAVLSAFSADARVYWPVLTLTREELEDQVVRSFLTRTWTGFGFKLIELFAHGDVAYAIYEQSGTRQVEGREPESVVWNCFARFEKEDGLWKDDREVCNAPEEG
jgi:hypothetical protein